MVMMAPERTRTLNPIDGVEIDLSARVVTVNGRRIITWTRMEWELLVYLAEEPTTVRTTEDLLLNVWGIRNPAGVKTRTHETTASKVRRKLQLPGVIVNVWAVGYRFVQPEGDQL